jgi:hypothetical protein
MSGKAAHNDRVANPGAEPGNLSPKLYSSASQFTPEDLGNVRFIHIHEHENPPVMP